MYFDAKSCAERIRNLRVLHNMTQEELCERINISERQLRRIELGKTGLPIDLLVEVAQMFRVSLDYLVLGKESYPDEIQRKINLVTKLMNEIASEMR